MACTCTCSAVVSCNNPCPSYGCCPSFTSCSPSFTSCSPCCNVPIEVDGLYQSRRFQEVYYAPEPPPKFKVVRQRLPDPPPDVIERVVVVPQAKKFVYQVVEVPTKPPPVIQERFVPGTPKPPVCAGTYRVQVPPKAGGHLKQIVRSSSNL